MNCVIVNGVDVTAENAALREVVKNLREAVGQLDEEKQEAESSARYWRQRARTADNLAATLTVQGLEAVAEAGGLARRLENRTAVSCAAVAVYGAAVGELTDDEAAEILKAARLKPLADVEREVRRGAHELLASVRGG